VIVRPREDLVISISARELSDLDYSLLNDHAVEDCQVIKPLDIEDIVWEVLSAANSGDLASMRRLLERDPSLSQKGYFYTPPIHFAVREGHLEIVEMLLAAGADAEWNGHYGNSLIDMAKERGHDAVAALLEKARASRGRTAPAQTLEDHAIHAAAQAGDLQRVRELLDADATLLNHGDRAGGTPLHRAVAGSASEVVKLLLDRGADIHAIHGAGLGAPGGFSPHDVQAIDIAIWGGFGRRPRPSLWKILNRCVRYWLWRRFQKPCARPHDLPMARLLLSRGATLDLTVAAALGDFDRVNSILAADPTRIRDARPNGRRALTVAVEFGHDDIARFLLDHGANPTWAEISAERGGALHAAARLGNRAMVELLLAHGADPNAHSDSAGNAVYAAKTPEIRALLKTYGGSLDPYDLVWLDEDDEVIRLVKEDPRSAELGCGGVFTAVVTRQKRDLLKRLLDAGIRVPPVVTGCQSYLLEQPDMLQTLLDNGMNPDTSSWQGQTLLHCLCMPDPDGIASESNTLSAAMLLDAGASISPREDQYSSTPLAWAARNNNPGMLRFLLSRGAPTNLPDDKPWATPLAWATRRGHANIVNILRAAGANS
jgi:ankyrin repeat protein